MQINKRVAIIHDWLIHMRGGEKCLDGMVEIFPDSEIFTLFYKNNGLSERLKKSKVNVSILNGLPLVLSYYRYLLPILPVTIERFNLKEFDLILSSSHCVAKGVRVPDGVPHISYCYTPMRYIWHLEDVYFPKDKYNAIVYNAIRLINNAIRRWDKSVNDSVTHFIAISKTVQHRIREYYGRESDVVYPPVDTDFYLNSLQKREKYFLIVSALVPYKRVDIAVRACKILKFPLIIIGDGPMRKDLEKIAGEKTRFLGWMSDEDIREYYSRAEALIFPGEEDFGIVPLEAQSCGTPVIAFNKGGARETIIANETGIFFDEQSADTLTETLGSFKQENFSSGHCRQNALRFSRNIYIDSLRDALKRWL